MLIVRSLVFNTLFYINLSVLLICALPTFFMPRWGILTMAKTWGITTMWLLRWICDVRVEFRGVDKIPPGALLVGAKHQSLWETCALLHLFGDFTFIVKRELTWIPIFGWFMIKAAMIPVNRGGRAQALIAMRARARRELARGRQIVIFPEGTRRAPHAPPAYKMGIAHLYEDMATPCLPVALNSGLFWPRRSILRYPGTILVEFLDPIPPGLDKAEFFARLQNEIETATARLVAEGEAELARRGIVRRIPAAT